MSMLNHKWECFAVGKCRAEWVGLPDGQVIDWTDMCGFTLLIYWNKPSKEEILAVNTRSYFEVAFKDIEGVGFFAFKFGNCEWCDCAFSPNIYDNSPKFEEIQKGQSYALHIMLIDTSNGELKYLRTLALGREFADYIRKWALQSLDKNISKRYYNKAVDEAYKKFPMPDDIARNADIRWVLPHGEERNLTVEEKE